MTSKRSNGEGTIYKNKERDRFEGQVTVGIKADGKPIRRKVSGRTKAEVVKRMAEVRERCTHGPGLASDVTVADWLGYWVSVVLPTADIASSTRESYEDLCAWYLIPRLGRIRLVKLSPADVRGMLVSMNSDGYSSNTQRLARAALRRALRIAEAEGYVQRNAAALTDGVKLDTKIGRTMTPDQVRALLSSVSGNRIEPVLHVLLATGFRRPMVAIWPLSRYLKTSRDVFATRRRIWRATCFPCWIATGATMGSGRPSLLGKLATSPTIQIESLICKCELTLIRFPRSVSPRNFQCGGATTPAAQIRVPATISLPSFSSSDRGVASTTAASTSTCTPILVRVLRVYLLELG